MLRFFTILLILLVILSISYVSVYLLAHLLLQVYDFMDKNELKKITLKFYYQGKDYVARLQRITYHAKDGMEWVECASLSIKHKKRLDFDANADENLKMHVMDMALEEYKKRKDLC